MNETKWLPFWGAVLFFIITVGSTGCAPSISNSPQNDPSRADISEEFAPAVQHTGQQLRIGVVSFLDRTSSPIPGSGDTAGDILETLLKKTNRFIMIPQQELISIINRQPREASGAINPAAASEMGKILGLNAIVTGSINEYSKTEEKSNYLIYKKKNQISQVTLDYRIVDATTGIQLMADSGQGIYSKKTGGFPGSETESAEDTDLRDGALKDALTKATAAILKQLSVKEWNGRITRVKGKRAYINAGQKSGLQVGSILVVQDPGEDIIDPQTGISLGKAPGAIKGKLIVTGLSGDDESIATIRSGGGFQNNDLVRIKK